MEYKKILFLGATGFIGTYLRHNYHRPGFIYFDRKEWGKLGDLTDPLSCYQLVRYYQPDAIIHLAGKVGGIKDNNNKQAEYYRVNTLLNTNIIHAAYECGVSRVLSALSTCAFPDIVNSYPFTEEDLHSGPPAKTNLTYGLSKRALHAQTCAYRQQYGVNYSTFCPSNIYGVNDRFDLDSGHFVPSMIRKFYEARDGETLEFWGDGEALRQQLYVDDLCKIMLELLAKHNTGVPLIVAPDENLSIKEMISILKEYVKKDVQIKFNGELCGQYRKDGSNKKLKELIGNYKFTSFKEGVSKTYDWYLSNSDAGFII